MFEDPLNLLLVGRVGDVGSEQHRALDDVIAAELFGTRLGRRRRGKGPVFDVDRH